MKRSGAPSPVERAAAAWAVRLDRGLSDREAAELAAWIGADARREGALVRAAAVLALLDQMDVHVFADLAPTG